jgi:hypothetical protein
MLTWRTGPNSNLLGKDNYPVVQVAYCPIMLNGLENVYLPKPNGNLPEEGERVVYIHEGSILKPEGKFQANIYQGEFG